MPSREAFTLVGKSSKCSSRGSEGRTRTGLAILARRLLRASLYCGCGTVATGFSLESLDTSNFPHGSLGWAESQGSASVSDRSNVAKQAPYLGLYRRSGDARETTQRQRRVEETTHAESILCDPPAGHRAALYRRIRRSRNARYDKERLLRPTVVSF